VENTLDRGEHDQRQERQGDAGPHPKRGIRRVLPHEPEASLEAVEEPSPDEGEGGRRLLQRLGHRTLRGVGRRAHRAGEAGFIRGSVRPLETTDGTRPRQRTGSNAIAVEESWVTDGRGRPTMLRA